jgi:hypothetical protein
MNGEGKSMLAHWKYASQKKDSKGNSFVSVPVFDIDSDNIKEEHLDKKTFDLYLFRETPFAINQLNIFTDEKGKLQYELIKYISDIKTKTEQEPNKFTGLTIVSDWNGKFIKGFKVKDGNILGNVYTKENIKNGKVLACEYIDTSWTEAGVNSAGEAYVTLHQSGFWSGCGGQDPNANSGIYSLIPTISTGGSWGSGTSLITLTPSEIAEIITGKINEILPGECWTERFYYIAHPIYGYGQGDIIGSVKAYSNLLFCSLGKDNDNKNAFRHMFWNALMGKKWGYAAAREMSDIHEECGGTITQTTMDKFNNDAGASFGHTHLNYSTFALAMETYCKIKNGEGKKMSTLTTLVPSDDEGNCNNSFNQIACLL